jgi:malonate decarboxylase alpha subunit
MKTETQLNPQWSKRQHEKQRGLAQPFVAERMTATEDIVPALEALIFPGDRAVLNRNNQKQADFLARSLTQMDPSKVNHLHLFDPDRSLKSRLGAPKREASARVREEPDRQWAGTERQAH